MKCDRLGSLSPAEAARLVKDHILNEEARLGAIRPKGWECRVRLAPVEDLFGLTTSTPECENRLLTLCPTFDTAALVASALVACFPDWRLDGQPPENLLAAGGDTGPSSRLRVTADGGANKVLLIGHAGSAALIAIAENPDTTWAIAVALTAYVPTWELER